MCYLITLYNFDKLRNNKWVTLNIWIEVKAFTVSYYTVCGKFMRDSSNTPAYLFLQSPSNQNIQ